MAIWLKKTHSTLCMTGRSKACFRFQHPASDALEWRRYSEAKEEK